MNHGTNQAQDFQEGNLPTPQTSSTRAGLARLSRRGTTVVACAALGVSTLVGSTLALPASASARVTGDAHQYGRDLFAVDGSASDDVWAVGLTPSDRTGIWHWAGSEWAKTSHPHSSYPSVFSGVDARTADDAWAVGSVEAGGGPDVAYAQRWNGERWRVVAADPGLFTSEAYAVSARTAKDAWLVGDAQENPAGYLVGLIEHWDGTTWKTVAGAKTGQDCDVTLRGISAVARDDAWAVGSQTCDGGQAALVEHWDGQRWSKVAVPTPKGADYVALDDVNAIAGDDIWAVGWFARGSHPGRNLTLHWDGKSWAQVVAPNPGAASCNHGLSGVSGSKAGDVWATSTRSCASGVKGQVLHWDGTEWAKVALPKTGFDNPPGDSMFDVVSVGGRSAFAVGVAKTSGKSVEVGFIQRWNGKRWSLQ